LIPGATIAKNGDSGVLFYNPALLAYNTKNAATISGNLYNYEQIKITNGAGTGFNLKSSSTSIIPMIISNTIYLKLKNKPFTVAYGLLHNPVMRFGTSQRRDDKFEVLDNSYSPGPEFFVGQYATSNTIDETTGILSFGKPVSSRLAVGISFNANVRKQTYQLDSRCRALVNTINSLGIQPIVNTSQSYFGSNTNIGLGIKAGLSYDLSDNHHLGLLVSSPLIHISGNATILTDNIINNLKLGNDTLYLLANSRQTGLSSKWKAPFSVALGYTYDIGKTQLYFTLEYFNKIGEYNVITPRNDYFIRPDTGNNILTSSLLKMKDARKAITNVAIGVSFPLKETVTGYCSFRTDFNYRNSNSFTDYLGIESSTAAWDLYHLQLGANFKKRKFNLRSGLMFNYGATNNYKQEINFDNPNENNFLLGNLGTAKATTFSVGLMFTYIHNL
jgi:hypothetical protein